MVVTLESVQKNKELYNENLKKIIEQRNELMKRVSEIRRKKEHLTDAVEMATADFEEAQLVQQISSLTSSFKTNQITLETLGLQEERLEGKIDNVAYSNGMGSTKKAKEKLSKEDALQYSENEVEKCKKAVKLYTLIGDSKRIEEWQQKLSTAERDLKYAREDLGLEEEKTQSVTNEEQRNGVNTRTVEEEDKTKTTKSINGVEVNSRTIYKDGSYDEKSRTVIADGQIDDFGKSITLSQDFGNFTAHQLKHDETLGIDTEKFINPVTDANGQVIGTRRATEVIRRTGQKTINIHEDIEDDSGIFNIETLSEGYGEEYREQRNMTINNKLSGSIENIQYTRDEQGNESYAYMENGALKQRIRKTERGTTIDIYKDGQPYESYEYDENGRAIIPMGKMQQLPEGYIENCFSSVIPEYSIVQHRVPEEAQIQEEQYQEKPENKTRTTENRESFRDSIRFEVTPEMHQDILRRHSEAEKNFEQEMAEHPEKRRTEQVEYGVK